MNIRFRFDSVDGCCNNYEGWHVDNIIIAKTVDVSVVVGEEEQNRAIGVRVRLAYPAISVLYGMRLHLISNTSSALNYEVRIVSQDGTVTYYSQAGTFTSTLDLEPYSLNRDVEGPVQLVLAIKGDTSFRLGVDEAVMLEAILGSSTGLLIANPQALGDTLLFFDISSNTTTNLTMPSAGTGYT